MRMKLHMKRIVAGLLAALTLIVPAGCSADSSAIGGLLDGLVSQGQSQSYGSLPKEWSLAAAPDYYTVVGKADFSGVDLPKAGEIRYAEPDALGRSGQAVGMIDKALRTEGSERERDMPSTITGWPKKNPEVDINLTADNTCSLAKDSRPKNTCYHGYLFNKSHLIAKSLGGQDIAKNMVTGTRTQNVGKNNPAGGMAYTESEARDWIDKHPDGTITYMATPNYTGDELLPRTVTVDIRTSDGSIDQRVVVWNTANGFTIDYAKGGTR